VSTLPSVNLNALFSLTGSSSSGIDVAGAVSQILYADRATERQWQAQQQTIDQQTSALNQMNGIASTLMDSLDSLQDPMGALMAKVTTSTQPSVVTATATAGAVSGSHVVSVQNLATTASWYSDPVADANTAFASDSFDLTVGTGSSQKITTVKVGNGINTPNQLASYVNSLGLGLTASVITDSSGARVALVSNNSGSASDFAVTATPDGSSTSMFTRAATGKDASITVDGIPITSATNTVTGVISGVTLNLNGQSAGGQVGLSIGADVTQATNAISAFVNAYNSLLSQVNSQFTYDATSQTAGPLSGDSTVRMLQSELLASPSYSGGSGAFSTLRSLGITMNDDGSLSIDNAALSTAVQNNPDAVQAFFQGSASNGFTASLKTAVNTFADPSLGAFTVDLHSLSDERSDLQNQINDFEDYLSAEQTRLTNEYNQANILLQQLPVQQKQIEAMLGNNSSGSNS
jgi:flagellar hook-associated protein 2